MLETDDDDREMEIDLEDGEEQEIQEEQEDGADKEDRGDDAEPEVNERSLRKLAADDSGEGEEQEDETEADGPSMIPKGRLNKALKARDVEREARIRAEERARMLEEQIQGQGSRKKEDDPAVVDLKSLRKQHIEAMMEGDIEKAINLDEQIEKEIRRAAREDAVAEVSAATARQQFAEAVSDVIEAYPFLDSKSKAPNADAIEQVVALRNQYINKGDSPATALRKAAKKIGPLYSKSTDGDEEDEDNQEEERPSKRILAVREQLALKRNADAARRQPAALKGGVGERATAAKLNVAEMDEDEYAKLPEKVKRQLRGDDV